MSKQLLRHLPAVEKLKQRIRAGHPTWPGELATTLARDVIATIRTRIEAGDLPGESAIQQAITDTLNSKGRRLVTPSLQPLLNGTGVLIHTNAGRAPLGRTALEAVVATSSGYCNLELGLADGKRGSRQDHIEDLVRWATGAQSAIVVNNNAAAVMLALHALAANRPVLVSRGELVEIGGSFRVPDVMTAAGAELVEVGTTNRTWVKDYIKAAEGLQDAGRPVAAIMQVHRSNFRLQGFVHSPTLQELASVARDLDIPLVVDLGAGLLDDPTALGLADEPTVAEALAAGADVVTFSGDKLLGGPQAGIIAGEKRWVKQLRGNPMARATRVDSMTLAALQVTLAAHLTGQAQREVPVVEAASLSQSDLEQAATALKSLLGRIDGLSARIQPCSGRMGGGSQPEEHLPSFAVCLTWRDHTVGQLASALRNGPTAVLGRISQERVLLDLRSLLCGGDPSIRLTEVADAVEAALRPRTSEQQP